VIGEKLNGECQDRGQTLHSHSLARLQRWAIFVIRYLGLAKPHPRGYYMSALRASASRLVLLRPLFPELWRTGRRDKLLAFCVRSTAPLSCSLFDFL
jgi:hypothetical protein